MTLTVKLDERDENRLAALLVANRCDKSELVRKLINEEFERLQTEKTLLERRGGHPQHLLHGPANLSERPTRKTIIADKVRAKASRRRPNE